MTQRASGRLPAIDGLRTVAVALVVIYHLSRGLLPGGAVGVDVFFVISGFVITGTLLRERAATGRIRFGQFYIRRWLRLMPALAFVSVAALLFSVVVGRLNWVGPLFSVTYLMDFARAYSWASPAQLDLMGHAWSLGIEEQFYLLWPALLALLFLLPRRWRLGLWAVVLVGPLVIRLATYSPGHAFQLYNLPWDRFDQLTVGAALAVAVTTAGVERIRAVARWAWWAGAAVIAVVAVGISVENAHGGLGAGYYTVGFLIVALAAAAVVAHLALSPESWPARLLAWGPISRFGLRYSYGLYLWHHFVFRAVDEYTLSRPVSVAAKLLVTAAGVLVSYWLIERPALRRKTRHEVPRSAWTEATPESVRR